MIFETIIKNHDRLNGALVLKSNDFWSKVNLLQFVEKRNLWVKDHWLFTTGWERILAVSRWYLVDPSPLPPPPPLQGFVVFLWSSSLEVNGSQFFIVLPVRAKITRTCPKHALQYASAIYSHKRNKLKYWWEINNRSDWGKRSGTVKR